MVAGVQRVVGQSKGHSSFAETVVRWATGSPHFQGHAKRPDIGRLVVSIIQLVRQNQYLRLLCIKPNCYVRWHADVRRYVGRVWYAAGDPKKFCSTPRSERPTPARR